MGATFGRSGLGAFRLAWTVFVVAATSIPYLLNWLSPPAGSHYTWIMPPYPEDSLAYRAWSEQSAHGSLLFQMKYTALPHAPFLFHPFFLIGGWISALTACDIGVVHWVLKAAGVAVFPEVLDNFGDLVLGIAVDDVRGRDGEGGVHAHVEGAVAGEGETAGGVVHVGRGKSQVRQEHVGLEAKRR